MKPKMKGNLAELYAAKTTMRRNMKTGQCRRHDTRRQTPVVLCSYLWNKR